MKTPEKYKNYFWGENRLFFPDEYFVIKLDFPRVFVRYNAAESYGVDYNEWKRNIVEIQYIEGDRPDDPIEHDQILTDIWNYIALEERKLEEDSEMFGDDY